MAFYEHSSFRDSASDGLMRQRFLGANNRTPCPVCGHPTGDCTGDSKPPHLIAGLGATESLKDIQNFLVEEDLLHTIQITPFTTAKVVLHAKGTYIPYREAERLGLIKIN